MTVSDRTEITSAPPVLVRTHKGEAKLTRQRFVYNFRLGRGEECDVRFSDPKVSSYHAEVFWENGKWWIRDLESRNGTFIDGTRITRLPLPARGKFELAVDGPVVELEIEQAQPKSPSSSRPQPAGMTQIAERYFSHDDNAHAGEHTRLIRQAFQRERKKQGKRYRIVLGVVLVTLVGTLGMLYYQHQRIKKLEQLHDTAENVFYTAKSIEVQLAKLLARPDLSADPQIKEMRREQQNMEARYDEFLGELGISRAKLSEQDWEIYKVARLFGECTVTMPTGFVETVKQYIALWKRSPLLMRSIARAQKNGYNVKIREVMLENGMPPQFFYLALKESNFDIDACGPETYAGIAKGIWQFIPATAYQYHLRTGPLVDVRKPDRLDERHDFEKSTVAAARYLHDLYSREAQASGLLVMACYNWQETRVRDMLNRMPENPRERNFWKLLNRNLIPKETYDYVFYIIAAAVIGENPRLFGFDLDNPLKDERAG
jgi:membrane-bound lytic murein transglycosylase D